MIARISSLLAKKPLRLKNLDRDLSLIYSIFNTLSLGIGYSELLLKEQRLLKAASIVKSSRLNKD